MRYTILSVLLCVLTLCIAAHAQQDSTQAATVYKLTLKDGSEIIGTIQREDSILVEFRSISKVSMRVLREQIRSLVRLPGMSLAASF